MAQVLKSNKKRINFTAFGGFWVDPKNIFESEKFKEKIQRFSKIPTDDEKDKKDK